MVTDWSPLPASGVLWATCPFMSRVLCDSCRVQSRPVASSRDDPRASCPTKEGSFSAPKSPCPSFRVRADA